MNRPSLVCLLPVRNAAAELPAWFASVERFADAVVALDDGSTDDSAATLEAHPLTTRLLRNPRRETYHGWNDSINRNRLLEAASELAPRWIMSLDADERIDPDDAATLRAAALGDADPDCGYLFRCYRMVGFDGHWDRADIWIGRMFGWRRGQRFLDDALHFVPLPVDLPAERWCRTTVRIQHFGSSTSYRRHQRYRKYTEADPHHQWQTSYDRLLDPPGSLNSWEARPPALPFVRHGSAPSLESQKDGSPAISAVLVSNGDPSQVRGSLASLVSQVCDESFEVILVTSAADTAAVARSAHPDVRVVEVDSSPLGGDALNAVLTASHGRLVSFVGQQNQARPGYLQGILDGHREGWAMTAGAIENGTRTLTGWAGYFVENSSTLPGRPEREFEDCPAATSYRRDVLEAAGGFPDIGHSGVNTFNNRLWEAGYGCWFVSSSRLVYQAHRSVNLLLRHCYELGRRNALVLLEEHDAGRLFTPSGVYRHVIVPVPGRLRRVVRDVRLWGSRCQRRALVRSFLLVATAAIVCWASSWIHALVGMIRRRTSHR